MAITTSALAIASLAVTAIGVGVSAYGQIQQSAAQQTQYKAQEEAAKRQNQYAADMAGYNLGVKKYNETMREYTARISEQATKIKMEQQRRRGLALLSSQRAGYGASGLKLEGTPLTVMSETAWELDKDIQNMKWEGEVEAWKIRSQQEPGVVNTSGMYSAGVNPGSLGWLSAGSTILTGMGDTLLKYGKIPTLGGSTTNYGSSKSTYTSPGYQPGGYGYQDYA